MRSKLNLTRPARDTLSTSWGEVFATGGLDQRAQWVTCSSNDWASASGVQQLGCL